MRRMDLRQLQYFTHVAQLGSFTKASTVLSIAQPALSRQIRLLEVELGQVLLHRTGRGALPTEAGKRLLAHSQGILAQVERAKLELDEVRGAPVGRLRLSIAPSIGPIIAMDLIAAFRDRFPSAELAIVEGMSAQVNEWLASGHVDVAINYSPIPSPQVETEPLIEHVMHLVGPLGDTRPTALRGQPVPLREVPRYPLILPNRPHSVRLAIDTQMANVGLKPNLAWEVDPFPTILQLVKRGLGYGMMPAASTRAYTEPGSVVVSRVVEPELPSILTLAWSAQRPLTPLAKQTMELVRELVPALLPG
jgi:LysR family nitrogen assimilation transcriptional regulator